MSTIDERIVEMKFKGSEFLNNIKLAKSALGEMKKELDLDASKKSLEGLDAAGKKFSLQGMADGIQGIADKFSALSIIGITAIANIANRAVNAGITMMKSLTVDPIRSGLQEYETKLGSIQTILANTQSKGSTLGDVSGALQELNTYSDKTIYNFGEMARNIGTFTAAGVGLKDSTTAIKGIANLAALSGSNSQQASSAMYQLSQAMAAGKVSLMDWNSVVYAGMGGEAFQTALINTAKAQGVAVDGIIEKNGSFRDSLQEGWLTSDILTKTLSTFTGDLTDDQLKSMGYTKDQIVSIQQMAKTASDAATKVKTFSQLIGTIQESVGSGWATSFELIFGDIEEAKELWTGVNNVVGAMVVNSANARNAMLTEWDKAGGRTAAIQAMANMFKTLMGFLTPVKEAFRDIFPAVTGEQLANITKAIADFTAKLIPSEAVMGNIKRTFAGVFAILDIGRMVLMGALEMFLGLFGGVGEGAGKFLEITANIGDFLVGLRNAIKEGDGLTRFFEGLGKVLAVPINLLRMLGGVLQDALAGITKIDTSGFTGAVDEMVGRLNPLKNIGDNIRKAWDAVSKAMSVVWDFFQPFAKKMGDIVSNLGELISEAFSGVDYNLVLDTINTGLFAGLVLLIKKFMSGGIGINLGGGFLEEMKGMFTGVTDTLGAMQTQLKAGALMKIAIAIGILTASILVLSMIDSAGLTKALGAITVMFTQLAISLSVFEKIAVGPGIMKMPVVAAALILLSTAILILSAAVKSLSGLSWEELAKGIGGVIVLLGVLVLTAKGLSGGFGPNMIAGGAALLILAFAIKVLASAVTDLMGLSWEELAKGMGGVAVLMLMISRFVNNTGNPVGIIQTAAAMVILGVALKIFASGVKDFAGMEWDELIRGLVGMALALGVVSVGMRMMPKGPDLITSAAALVVVSVALIILAKAFSEMAKLNWDDIGRVAVIMQGAMIIITGAVSGMTGAILGAASLAIVAASLVLMAYAFQEMAEMSWDDIGRVAVILAGSLLIIAGALYLMTAALPGAAALIVAAAALMILAPALIALGGMEWDEIGRGLAVLASALGILAIGGLLLIVALPGLLGLAVAATLIGAATLAAGIGITMFAAGFTALALAMSIGGVAIVGMISAIIGLIPYAMQQLAVGILAFAQVIATGGPAITAALVTVLLSLIGAINTVAPQIIATLMNLLWMLVDTIVAGVPRLVDSGMKLIIGILTGISNNIGKIVTVATSIVVNFINGIAANLPRIIQAGINLIITFVNGLADGIRNNQAKMEAAGGNLASAIVQGITGGLSRGIGKVIEGARNLAQGALNAAKNLLGIKSPSREFKKVGVWSAEGMAGGLDAGGKVVSKAAAGVGTTALVAIRKSMAGIAAAVATDMDMTPTIRPVLDLSAIKRDAGLIPGMMSQSPLSIDKTYAKAASIAVGQRASEEAAASLSFDDVPTQTVVFEQHNHSPKALSSAEIYRNTNNQLSVAKGALKPNAK